MERKYLMIGLFLTVVLVTNMVIFTASAQGEDDCNVACINYWITAIDPPVQSWYKMYGRDPQFPCFSNEGNADEIVVEDRAGNVLYHLTGGLPERIQYGGSPLELATDDEYNEYKLKFYKAGKNFLRIWFQVLGTRTCPTNTSTTTTPVITTTVPNTSTTTPVTTTTVPNTLTTTTTPCVICLGGDSLCCGDPDCCSDCCDEEFCCGNHCCPIAGGCCGDDCCDLDEQCCGNHCCYNYQSCCGVDCCDPDEQCCNNNHCCPWGLNCCGDTCCEGFQNCCGNACCDKGDICSNGVCIPCAVTPLYGEGSEEVELLRAFRDEVLSQSPVGQEIIELYYMWSPTIAKVMEEDEEFKDDVKELVDGVLELIVEDVE